MQDGSSIQTRLIIDTTTRITDSNNLTPFVVEETCSVTPYIPKALNADTCSFQWHPNALRCLSGNREHSCGSSIITTLAATNRERFSSHHCGNRKPFVH